MTQQGTGLLKVRKGEIALCRFERGGGVSPNPVLTDEMRERDIEKSLGKGKY